MLGYSRDNLLEFVDVHYVPENMVVSIAGNIKHSDAVKLIKKYFNKKKEQYTHKRSLTEFKSGQKLINKAGLQQVNLIIGWNSCNNKDIKNVLIRDLLNSILGSGMSSRLFTEIREKRGLVYSIFSFSSNSEDVGMFVIIAGTDDEKLEELLEATFNEVNTIASTVTQDELDENKISMLSDLLMSQEGVSNIALGNISEYFDYGKVFEIEEIREIIKDINLNDIRYAANDIFTTEPNIVVLANKKIKSIPLKI